MTHLARQHRRQYSKSRKPERYSEMYENSEPGDGPDLRSPPKRQELPGRATRGRGGTARTSDTRGSMRAKRSGVEDGGAVSLTTRAQTAGALLTLRGASTQEGEGRRGDLWSCKMASAIAPENEHIATGRSAITSRRRALSSKNSFRSRWLSSSGRSSQCRGH